jgi:hypothetical protein
MADDRATYWSTPDRRTSVSVVYYKDSGCHVFVVFTAGRMAQLCATANEAVRALKWPGNLPTGAAVREFLTPWGYEAPVKKQPNDNTKTII